MYPVIRVQRVPAGRMRLHRTVEEVYQFIVGGLQHLLIILTFPSEVERILHGRVHALSSLW